MILHKKPIRRYRRESKRIMREHDDIPWIHRANRMRKPYLSIPFGDSKQDVATHYLTYFDSDNAYKVMPEVAKDFHSDSNKLIEIPKKSVYDYNYENDNILTLPYDKYDRDFVDYFTSVGYKRKFPRQIYKEAKKEYKQRLK